MNWKKLIAAVAVAAALWFVMFSPWTAGLANFWLEMSCSAVILTAMVLCLSPRRQLRSGQVSVPDNNMDGDAADIPSGSSGLHRDAPPPHPYGDAADISSGSSGLLQCVFQLALGVAIAIALWGIFWIGDKLSSMMFGFARPQVDSVYAMKTGLPAWAIALLLLFVIGPAEEFFWRGFVQKNVTALFAGGHYAGATMEEAASSAYAPGFVTSASFYAFAVTTVIYALIHVWSLNFMLVMAALVAGAVWGFIYMLRPKLLPALIVSHALWDALVFVILPI